MTQPRSGFTIIELIIVMVLIGIVAGTIYRAKSTTLDADAKLYATSNQLLTELNYLRENALNLSLPHKMVFDMVNHQYDMFKQDSSTNNVWVIIKDNTDIIDQVTFQSTTFPNQQVVFGSLGEPYEDPQGDSPQSSMDNALGVARTLVIVTAGSTHTISVHPETGFVQRSSP